MGADVAAVAVWTDARTGQSGHPVVQVGFSDHDGPHCGAAAIGRGAEDALPKRSHQVETEELWHTNQ